MGLDMFLTRTVEAGKDSKGRNTYVKTDVMYWRKANAIHGWFVDNVCFGNDDCLAYKLTGSQLAELRDTCNEVLANRGLCEELLPTVPGFFFGGTEYDERYFESLKTTAEQIDDLLEEHEPQDWFNECWYEYHASW